MTFEDFWDSELAEIFGNGDSRVAAYKAWTAAKADAAQELVKAKREAYIMGINHTQQIVDMAINAEIKLFNMAIDAGTEEKP